MQMTLESHSASNVYAHSLIAEENQLQVGPKLLVEGNQGVQLQCVSSTFHSDPTILCLEHATLYSVRAGF